MAKRFIGTDIWGQDWFLDMPNEYKLFWNYILCECDHAGFYKVNVKTFARMTETKVDAQKALEYFNVDKGRIRVVSTTVWFIEDFIVFQYGSQLNSANRVHDSILKLLAQFDLNLTSIRGLINPNQGVKDKDKDKDKDSFTVLPFVREDGWSAPTLEQSIKYFSENNYSEDGAHAAWEYYDDLKWKDKDGNDVINWKLKYRNVWFKEKYKIEPLISVEDNYTNASGREPKPLFYDK